MKAEGGGGRPLVGPGKHSPRLALANVSGCTWRTITTCPEMEQGPLTRQANITPKELARCSKLHNPLKMDSPYNFWQYILSCMKTRKKVVLFRFSQFSRSACRIATCTSNCRARRSQRINPGVSFAIVEKTHPAIEARLSAYRRLPPTLALTASPPRGEGHSFSLRLSRTDSIQASSNSCSNAFRNIMGSPNSAFVGFCPTKMTAPAMYGRVSLCRSVLRRPEPCPT